jgi:hypothetical protein
MDRRGQILLTRCPGKPIIPTENGFAPLSRLTMSENSTNGSVAVASMREKWEAQGGQICDRIKSSKKI